MWLVQCLMHQQKVMWFCFYKNCNTHLTAQLKLALSGTDSEPGGPC